MSILHNRAEGSRMKRTFLSARRVLDHAKERRGERKDV
jgi:hypothetical protein